MTLVVDACVALKWVVREPGNDAARRLLELADPLIAPDWLLVEAASTLWKKVKRSELLELHAERHLDDLPAYFSRLYPAAALVEKALHTAFRLRHSVYDCIYLELARRESCKLVTADAKFHRKLVDAGFGHEADLLEYEGRP